MMTKVSDSFHERRFYQVQKFEKSLDYQTHFIFVIFSVCLELCLRKENSVSRNGKKHLLSSRRTYRENMAGIQNDGKIVATPKETSPTSVS
jgi:hypothetical protein